MSKANAADAGGKNERALAVLMKDSNVDRRAQSVIKDFMVQRNHYLKRCIRASMSAYSQRSEQLLF